MRKTARTSSGAWKKWLCVAAFLGMAACAGETGPELEAPCRTDSDCPHPERQTCVRTWGVCVGQTNDLGAIDAAVD